MPNSNDQTPLLSMPYIQGAQAQKHVTHNEALELLDIVIQLTVEAVDATAPPSSAADGQAWIVGIGATGAWSSYAGQIAAWRGGGWLFVAPQIGWRAWDKINAVIVVYDGTGWAEVGGTPDLQNLDGVGINASFDATNKLAVAADATLLNHDGNGHQLKINKAGPSETASLLYQSGFSGRAEMGLAGNDDFSIKVSGDGSTFTEALRIDAATGAVEMPATGLRQILPYAYRHDLYADKRWTAPSGNPITKAAVVELGTQETPTMNWTLGGVFLPAGSVIHGFKVAGFISHSDIADLDLRIYFQTGPWDGTWNNSSATLRTSLFSQNNAGLTSGAAMQQIFVPLAYTAPTDGHVFLATRASNNTTTTDTRYFFVSGAIDATCARLSV